jgi:hypothetical protein
MEGSSLHCHYSFTETERINAHCLLGNVKLESARIFNKGAIQTIHPGSTYIHSLFHFETPSATLIVRTPKIPGVSPQYNYHPPHLALDPHVVIPLLERRRQLITNFLSIDKVKLIERLGPHLKHFDKHTCIEILRSIVQRSDIEEPEIQELHDILRTLHGEIWTDLVLTSLREHTRSLIVSRQRGTNRSTSERFILGLLRNYMDRTTMLRLVEEHYPEEEPQTFFKKTILAMARDNNLCGIELTETTAFILESLLDGESEGKCIEHLKEEYGTTEVEESRAEILLHIEELRGHPLFSRYLKTNDVKI